MSIIFVLIPLGLGLLAIALWAFLWAVDNDQFDDFDRAAHSILFDEEEELDSIAGTTREAGDETTLDIAVEDERE